MPSPFPGMDPYLEASLWTTVHSLLSGETVRQLAPLLRPRYLALPNERYVERVPPEITVEIRDVASRRLVTAIEVLSPTNKRGDGREEYLEKRGRLLRSDAHLMEIDLLRQGQRVPMRQALPAQPYFVFLTRAATRPLTEVWPVALDQPLPTVPVPLLPGDRDVPLDLQTAFTSVYDAVGYDLAVDYTRPPEAPLVSPQAAWAEQRLRSVRERQ